jgi:hypothetical protein
MRKKDLSIIIERSGHGNLFSAYWIVWIGGLLSLETPESGIFKTSLLIYFSKKFIHSFWGSF